MKVALALLAACAMLSACASIVSGDEQQVTVVTAAHAQPVAGSACTLRNTRGMWTVVAPGTAKIRRADDALWVRCEGPGYRPRATQIESGVNGMVFGNILIGGIIGYVIDRSSGAAFKYPDRIAVDMGDAGPGAAVGMGEPIWTVTRVSAATMPPSAVLQNMDGSAYLSGTRYIAPW